MHKQQFRAERSGASQIMSNSHLSVHTVNYVCTVQGSREKIQAQTHYNFIGRSMTFLPPVIAQQYSSAIFVSLCFYSCKEKFGVPNKNITSPPPKIAQV
jgi:hypothetical protein